MLILSRETQTLAALLQEGFDFREASPMHSNVQGMLSKAVDSAHSDGGYGYYVDHSGDGTSGDVVYKSNGNLKKTSYSVAKADGKTTATIAHDKAKNVSAVLSYKEADAVASTESGQLNLTESAATLETILLKESRSDYEIKLIAPGRGSSAVYPAEVLKRDGPKAFQSGTHVYMNHQTASEEASRPEGDVKNLAGVLTTGAVYHEAHAKGPGLYARMKVFADHGQTVEEKAAHVGMSIRAVGSAVMEGKRPKLDNGLPILAALVHGESVDVVTRAGAGGMILTESERGPGTQQEVVMTKEEIQTLVEAGVKAALANITAPVSALEARAMKGDATVEATKVLAPLALGEASKQRVIETVLAGAIPVKDGVLDTVQLGVLVTAEAKKEAAYVASLTGNGRVIGMGTTAAAAVATAETRKPEEILAGSVKVFERLGMSPAAAARAAKGRTF